MMEEVNEDTTVLGSVRSPTFPTFSILKSIKCILFFACCNDILASFIPFTSNACHPELPPEI